jgi:hypothetical protein
VLHGHVLEVCKLHPRPHHEVLGEAGHVGVLKALGGGGAFEVGHGGEEETCGCVSDCVCMGLGNPVGRKRGRTHIHRRKDQLVTCDSGDDGAVLGV